MGKGMGYLIAIKVVASIPKSGNLKSSNTKTALTLKID